MNDEISCVHDFTRRRYLYIRYLFQNSIHGFPYYFKITLNESSINAIIAENLKSSTSQICFFFDFLT